MTLRILATADMHLGRRPSKVPDPGTARRFSCANMWEAIVDRAVRERVDLVLLAGDVVDQANRFFEATGPLERGLRRLAEHEIDTYAVAGNHDHQVLPQLVDTLQAERFHLLGRDGQWEEVIVRREGKPSLRLHGWSFPTEYVTESPLADYPPTSVEVAPAEGDLATIGLLHADLNAAGSRFAPVLRSELDQTAVDLWVLGHVHASQRDDGGSTPGVLYPGSPQAMDPGEPGRHGPWLIEMDGPGQVQTRMLAMSKIRYERLEVDLSGAETLDEFESLLVDRVRQSLREVAGEEGPPELLSLRVELTGGTTLCGQVGRHDPAQLDDLELSEGEVTARIDKLIDSTRPTVDLEQLAQRDDPPGRLAGILGKIDRRQSDPEVQRLLDSVGEKLLAVHGAAAYRLIDKRTPGDAASEREMVLRQGMRLLETLLGQER